MDAARVVELKEAHRGLIEEALGIEKRAAWCSRWLNYHKETLAREVRYAAPRRKIKYREKKIAEWEVSEAEARGTASDIRLRARAVQDEAVRGAW